MEWFLPATPSSQSLTLNGLFEYGENFDTTKHQWFRKMACNLRKVLASMSKPKHNSPIFDECQTSSAWVLALPWKRGSSIPHSLCVSFKSASLYLIFRELNVVYWSHKCRNWNQSQIWNQEVCSHSTNIDFKDVNILDYSFFRYCKKNLISYSENKLHTHTHIIMLTTAMSKSSQLHLFWV